MAAYISESHRYYRLAKKIREQLGEDHTASYSVVGCCASYLESVANDVIFSWQLNQREGFPNFELDAQLQTIDLDGFRERIGSYDKWSRIIHRELDPKSVSDDQLASLQRLIRLRNRLVHLKPTEQIEGEAQSRGPEEVLGYLFAAGIIEDPFASGVYWADVITHGVSDWAIDLVTQFLGHAFHTTFFEPFGIQVLRWECQQLGILQEKQANQSVQTRPTSRPV